MFIYCLGAGLYYFEEQEKHLLTIAYKRGARDALHFAFQAGNALRDLEAEFHKVMRLETKGKAKG
jgi:hypothetical protein